MGTTDRYKSRLIRTDQFKDIPDCNLLAKILANILTSELIKEIGLYDSHSCGSFPGFGITTIRASRMDSGNIPSFSAAIKTFGRCGTRLSLCSWYHFAGKPSNPGDLPGKIQKGIWCAVGVSLYFVQLEVS